MRDPEIQNEGYEVDTANSAEEALKMNIGSYNLLLLDVMMGEISGFKMASLLKKDKKTAQVPIIFITAKDTENDTVTGFNLGADDYISKPFSLREVIARVKAVLRRTQQGEQERAPEQISYKTLVRYYFYSSRARDAYSPAKIYWHGYGATRSMCWTAPSM